MSANSNLAFLGAVAATWGFFIVSAWIIEYSYPGPPSRVHMAPASLCDGVPSALQPTVVEGTHCSMTGFVSRHFNPLERLLSHTPPVDSPFIRISSEVHGDGDWVAVQEKSVIYIENPAKQVTTPGAKRVNPSSSHGADDEKAAKDSAAAATVLFMSQ